MTPAAEQARLAALARYAILDTAPEAAYDDLARLAAAVCGAPVALVSLLDDARQWFKARVGVDAAETPRAVAFCDHAIRSQGEVLVVPDAAADPRFKDNPLVTAGPRIRFYAGAPLVTPDGHALGTLCAIDPRPRGLTPAQRDGLAALARQVVTALELRRAGLELRRANAELVAARAEVTRLEELVVMCAWDRTVRLDGRWVPVEEYLRARVGVRVSHGLSDAAYARLMADLPAKADPPAVGT